MFELSTGPKFWFRNFTELSNLSTLKHKVEAMTIFLLFFMGNFIKSFDHDFSWVIVFCQ